MNQNERINYTSDMHLHEKRISVSLATAKSRATRAGARFVFAEQGAFLDGYDNTALREQVKGDLFGRSWSGPAARACESIARQDQAKWQTAISSNRQSESK